MSRIRKPQTFGGGKDLPRWDYNDVPKSTKWRGWIAGPPTGTFLHFKNRNSAPCHGMMTDLALPCERCGIGEKWEWKGYVPYYDEQYLQRFAIISGGCYESVLELDHLAPILISRAAKATDPVIIQYSAWRATPIPFSVERAKPVDLMPFLLRVLWKDVALQKWECGQITQSALPGMSADNTPKPIDDGKELPATRKTLNGWVEVALGEKSEKVDRVRRNEAFVEASKNGKHKKH